MMMKISIPLEEKFGNPMLTTMLQIIASQGVSVFATTSNLSSTCERFESSSFPVADPPTRRHLSEMGPPFYLLKDVLLYFNFLVIVKMNG